SAPAANLLDVGADRVNARPDAAAIGLELRLAGTPRADSAAQSRQRVAGADQSRQQILQLRELDLELAFPRPRPPREDVEYQLRPIDDRAADLLLDLPQLRRRQLVVEDHDVDVGLGARGCERLHLPRAEERRWVRLGTLLQDAQGDVGARGLRQTGELVERSLRLEPARPAPVETVAADPRRAVPPRYPRHA